MGQLKHRMLRSCRIAVPSTHAEERGRAMSEHGPEMSRKLTAVRVRSDEVVNVFLGQMSSVSAE